MLSRGCQPTILIFTRGAKRERIHRRLLPERFNRFELELHRRCFDAVIEAARRVGCRISVSSPAPLDLPADVEAIPQPGSRFGDRLRSALAYVLDRSPGPVLVVGTDVPGLSADLLSEALESLRQDPDAIVLGPAQDGGFYLLGTTKPLNEELGEVRWCRPDTLSSLVDQLVFSGRHCCFLASLFDLDKRRDLERWLSLGGSCSALARRLAAWRVFLGVLREILAVLRRLAVPAAIGSPIFAHEAPRRDRAPPLPA